MGGGRRHGDCSDCDRVTNSLEVCALGSFCTALEAFIRKHEYCGELGLVGHPMLGIPDLKAFVVQAKRSPSTRRDSHRHPLVRCDDLSASVAGAPGAQTMAKLDQMVSWKTALLNSLSDELTTEVGVHRAEREDAMAVLAHEISQNAYSALQGLTPHRLRPTERGGLKEE